jgi:hypothetical protein
MMSKSPASARPREKELQAIAEYYDDIGDEEELALWEEHWAQEDAITTPIRVPRELVPAVQALIAHYRALHEDLGGQQSLVEVG